MQFKLVVPKAHTKFGQGAPYTLWTVTEHKIENKFLCLTLTIRKTSLPQFPIIVAH